MQVDNDENTHEGKGSAPSWNANPEERYRDMIEPGNPKPSSENSQDGTYEGV
jgi:hypothetical protein